MIRQSIVFITLFFSSFTISAQPLEFSVGANIIAERIQVGGADKKHKPILSEIEFAANHLDYNFGVSVHLAQSLEDDEKLGLSFDVVKQNSIFVNYSGRDENDYRVILSVGYTAFEIDSQSPSENFVYQKSFNATSFAVTLQESRFLGVEDLVISGGYRHLFDEDLLVIRGFNLGVKYVF